MSIGAITRRGENLIEVWKKACDDLKNAEAARERAIERVSYTSAELAAWLRPPADTQRPGEIYCVWHIDSLLMVKAGSNQIEVRYRGRQSGSDLP